MGAISSGRAMGEWGLMNKWRWLTGSKGLGECELMGSNRRYEQTVGFSRSQGWIFYIKGPNFSRMVIFRHNSSRKWLNRAYVWAILPTALVKFLLSCQKALKYSWKFLLKICFLLQFATKRPNHRNMKLLVYPRILRNIHPCKWTHLFIARINYFIN